MMTFQKEVQTFTRGYNPIKSHWITIFLWFSHGFPMVFPLQSQCQGTAGCQATAGGGEPQASPESFWRHFKPTRVDIDEYMYMYIYVYMSMYIYIYICTYVYIYVYIYMYIYIYIYIWMTYTLWYEIHSSQTGTSPWIWEVNQLWQLPICEMTRESWLACFGWFPLVVPRFLGPRIKGFDDGSYRDRMGHHGRVSHPRRLWFRLLMGLDMDLCQNCVPQALDGEYL